MSYSVGDPEPHLRTSALEFITRYDFHEYIYIILAIMWLSMFRQPGLDAALPFIPAHDFPARIFHLL